MPYYNAGDYYGRGDYYQGDPGIFSFLKNIGGAAIRVIGGAVKGAIGGGLPGAIVGAIGGSVGATAAGIQRETIAAGNVPMIAPPAPVGIMATGGHQIITQSPLGTPVSAGALQRQLMPFGMRKVHANRSTYVTRGGGTSRWPAQLLVHPKGTEAVPSRRMNVANPRALRRSLRRIGGFGKLVKRMKHSIGRANSAVGNVHHARKAKRR